MLPRSDEGQAPCGRYNLKKMLVQSHLSHLRVIEWNGNALIAMFTLGVLSVSGILFGNVRRAGECLGYDTYRDKHGAREPTGDGTHRVRQDPRFRSGFTVSAGKSVVGLNLREGAAL